MDPVRDGGVPDREPDRWHARTAVEVLAALASDGARGLSRAEAARRLTADGANALPEPPRRSTWASLGQQLRSPLIYLLVAAAAVALALGHVGDGVVILVVVVINAIIGASQEGRAERALAGLRRLVGQDARVCRDGHDLTVATRDVVRGDVVVLAAGDAVPADARVIESASLHVAEAALTGESVPVAKHAGPVARDAALAERASMVFAGTLVTAGRARAVVIATASATEFGRIANLAEAARSPTTPLARRVARFGHLVMIAALLLFGAIIAVGLARGMAAGDIAMIAISQAVGMVPEGLPVAMTIALAVGVQRMARRRAIVRQLAAVETLGAITVICSDKTGTLTRNEMTVVAVALPGRGELAVSGAGYGPDGAITDGDRRMTAADDAGLRALIEAAVLCNDAGLRGPDPSDPRWRATGDPTEAALVTLGHKAGLDAAALRARWPRRGELPFDPDRQLMATGHGGAGHRVALKGSPEAVVALCGAVRRGDATAALDDATRAAVRADAVAMAGRALRVLAIAEVDGAELDASAGFAGLTGRATLVGLVGELDPPRPEAGDAVARCRAAGIRPIMLTGDHKATGVAIARLLGMYEPGDVALEGAELDAMSDDQLTATIARARVFARVQPAQKLRIVTALQARGEVVAMTGDGVNDAPALVRADVGVAMGLSGTEVAKEAAKIVITDDDFATIVAAIEEGRGVYHNIKKAILLLITTSVAEVMVLLVAMLLGYPAPFAAVQILWNNLVTEGVITVNLVMDPPAGDELQRPPVPRDEPLFPRALLGRAALLSLAIVISTLGWFTLRLRAGVPLAVAQAETFTLLAVCEWFNVLNCRSERRSALNLSLLTNRWLVGGLVVGNALQIAVIYLPPMNRLFHTVPFGLGQVLAIGAVGSLVLWVEELRKLIVRRRAR